VADPVQNMELIKREYNNIIFVVSNFEMGVDSAMLRRPRTNFAIRNPIPFKIHPVLCKPSKADQRI
jgi:hypothetical protein